jgi:hypothetical protein
MFVKVPKVAGQLAYAGNDCSKLQINVQAFGVVKMSSVILSKWVSRLLHKLQRFLKEDFVTGVATGINQPSSVGNLMKDAACSWGLII